MVCRVLMRGCDRGGYTALREKAKWSVGARGQVNLHMARLPSGPDVANARKVKEPVKRHTGLGLLPSFRSAAFSTPDPSVLPRFSLFFTLIFFESIRFSQPFTCYLHPSLDKCHLFSYVIQR